MSKDIDCFMFKTNYVSNRSIFLSESDEDFKRIQNAIYDVLNESAAGALTKTDQEFLWCWLNLGLCEMTCVGFTPHLKAFLVRAREGLPLYPLKDRPSNRGLVCRLDTIIAHVDRLLAGRGR